MKSLVAGYLERISSGVFDSYHDEITALIGKRHGVYSLYKRERLYYVGLAKDLRGRVRHHLKDKHAHKWDTFSLYLVANVEHLRELETLIVHIAEPKGNVQAGKFTRATNLRRALEDLMEQRDKDVRSRILRGRKKRVVGVKRGSHARTVRRARKPPLAGLFSAGTTLRVSYRKNQYVATVDEQGHIIMNGVAYNSPSAAGSAVRNGKPTDGWFFWKFQDKTGNWVILNERRIGKSVPS